MDGGVFWSQVVSCGCCSAGMEWEGCDRQAAGAAGYTDFQPHSCRQQPAAYCLMKPALSWHLQLQ